MALKLIAPVEETFPLEETDKRFEVEGDPTIVTIRQATQRQHERRQQLFSKVERRMDYEDDALVLIQELSISVLHRLEVYLTLVDCNILGENGKPLFRFKKAGERQYLDMTEAQFADAWGQLPPFVCTELHEKVLLVNKTWDPNWGEVP